VTSVTAPNVKKLASKVSRFQICGDLEKQKKRKESQMFAMYTVDVHVWGRLKDLKSMIAPNVKKLVSNCRAPEGKELESQVV